MRKLRSIVVLLLGAVSMGAVLPTVAAAQRPPPPVANSPALDRSKPRLLHGQLDRSFCIYPRQALLAGLEGCCRMKVQITPDGHAGKMSGQCTDPVFLQPSKACLIPQTYLPALKRGKPVESTIHIVVGFHMQADPVSSFLGKFFSKAKPPKPPEPEICKPRPDDLVAALERYVRARSTTG